MIFAVTDFFYLQRITCGICVFTIYNSRKKLSNNNEHSIMWQCINNKTLWKKDGILSQLL